MKVRWVEDYKENEKKDKENEKRIKIFLVMGKCV